MSLDVVADGLAALAQVFDLLGRAIGRASGRHRRIQGFQSGLCHQIWVRRNRSIGKLDGRGRFGALFAGERNTHRFALCPGESRNSRPRCVGVALTISGSSGEVQRWISRRNEPSHGRTILETSLYRPVKAFLEGLGFLVKGEIGGCDLLALRGDDPPLVGDRRTQADLQSRARLAGGRPRGPPATRFGRPLASRRAEKGGKATSRFRNLCRRLGFGLLGVLANGEVQVLVSPAAPTPRKNPRRRSRLVAEHRPRRGDPVEGGGNAQADHDGVSPERSRLRGRVDARPATSAGPQSIDPRGSQDPSRQCLWLVRSRRARGLRSDRARSGRAYALAAALNRG